MKLILIDNLCKSYKKQPVLKNICLELKEDFIYFLTSINGTGKTTFFKCLLNEVKYEGSIIDQNMVYAYLPERMKMPYFITLKDYIKMFLDMDFKYFYGPMIDDYLELFDILKYKDKYIHELSKGTKQKALIIKTVLSNADVYLFDEPLNGLDERSRYTFMSLIKSLQEQKKIIIIASHYYDEYKFSNKKVIDL